MARTNRMIRKKAKDLLIHPEAQRELVPSNLRRIKRNPDLDAIGVVHAVEYEIDGVTGLWLVDGYHRQQFLMDSGNGEHCVDVMVHVNVTDDAGAHELFLKLNSRAPISPFDSFINELKAGHSDAVGVYRIARKNGLKVSRGCADGSVTCVSALKAIYRQDGGAALNKTLSTVVAAWGTTASAVEGNLLLGIGAVYAKHNGNVDQSAMVKKLSKYPGGPSAVIGSAKGLRDIRKMALARCVAECVVHTYNKGRRKDVLEAL